MTSAYERYVEHIRTDISEVISQFGCQPILFVGSGLSRRYINAPSWNEFLSHLARQCHLIDREMGFYRQTLKTPLAIGEEFARLYQEWAWSSGHNEFPDNMFTDDIDSQAYIKFKIAEYLQSLTPDNFDQLADSAYIDEIRCLQQIRPHAIITTNYDKLLELLFPDHEPIIGQQILRGQSFSIGELFKIHGCVDDFEQIVFTQSDYDSFSKKKKFLSAKLLTFFNEHPLIFIGYSASDPNIRSILSDIDEALPNKGGIIPNVYILEWDSEIVAESTPPADKVIPTEEDRTIRVKLIKASDFSWVFDAFAATPALNNVSPKVLRSLVARSYSFVRNDIPAMRLEVDFEMLTKSVASRDEFAKLFGIANIDANTAPSATHPYTATQIGEMLGKSTWHITIQLLDQIKDERGIDLKASDNDYHRTEHYGKNALHKYSNDMFELLNKVRDGDTYEIHVD